MKSVSKWTKTQAFVTFLITAAIAMAITFIPEFETKDANAGNTTTYQQSSYHNTSLNTSSDGKLKEYPRSEEDKYLPSVANKWYMDGTLIRGEKYFPEQEFHTILMAADRNECYGDNFIILLAIRLAEAGSEGKEFGVIHPKCDRIMANRPSETLDIQAGWAAATVVKNRQRWISKGETKDFIEYLGSVYCPIEDKNDTQGLNINWIPNVKRLYNKMKNG